VARGLAGGAEARRSEAASAAATEPPPAVEIPRAAVEIPRAAAETPRAAAERLSASPAQLRAIAALRQTIAEMSPLPEEDRKRASESAPPKFSAARSDNARSDRARFDNATADTALSNNADANNADADNAHSDTAREESAPSDSAIVPLLTREQCIARAQTALAGRNMSLAVANVIAMADSTSADLSDIASVIGHDPVLSVRVLLASNRASHSANRSVITTIPEAVRLLGCSTIRDIAASIGLFDVMPPPSADGFDPIRSWQHSLAVARLCQRLSPPDSAGTAYVVGLFHDLGEILFRTTFGTEYSRLLQLRAETGKPLHELERAVLGITHGQLVQTILRCMKLPDAISRPIADYHESILRGDAPREPLARILQIADLYATGMLLAPSAHSTIRPFSKIECRRAAGSEDPTVADIEKISDEIYSMTALYTRPLGNVQTNASLPYFARHPARLLIVREASLSSFDPISAAMKSLAKVTIRATLPAPADLSEQDGLVVLTRTDAAPGFTANDISRATRQADGRHTAALWLVAKSSGTAPADDDEPKPTLWPISLDALARFVSSVVSVDPST
jgi:HD-like signal output (HDOD) protein